MYVWLFRTMYVVDIFWAFSPWRLVAKDSLQTIVYTAESHKCQR